MIRTPWHVPLVPIPIGFHCKASFQALHDFSYKENTRKGMVFRNQEVLTHPTVVIVTNAHQKPSHVPLMKGLGNSSGFLRRSCITKINEAHHNW